MGNALADKPVGKYQIAIGVEDVWLVDTSNGKVWHRLGLFGWQGPTEHGGIYQPHRHEVSQGRLPVCDQVQATDHAATCAGQIHGVRGVRASHAEGRGQAARC